jgi:hypothetical protein
MAMKAVSVKPDGFIEAGQNAPSMSAMSALREDM